MGIDKRPANVVVRIGTGYRRIRDSCAKRADWNIRLCRHHHHADTRGNVNAALAKGPDSRDRTKQRRFAGA